METEGRWWCKSHQRYATHFKKNGDRCCDPKLGGITLPCYAEPMKKCQREGCSHDVAGYAHGLGWAVSYCSATCAFQDR